MANKRTNKQVRSVTTSVNDSFQNFQASLGIGTNNLFSRSSYQLNPLTRVRLELELMYRGSWIAAAAIDLPAEDMTRSGIVINDLDQADHDEIQEEFIELGIWNSLCEVVKWARLFGGSLAYLMIDGQDPATPLNINSVGMDQFKGLMILDRWQVNPSISDVVTDLGPDFGLPRYYDILASKVLSNTVVRVHHSRMIRFTGIDLPFQQRITEMGWGESVLERLNDRLVAFDSVTTGAAQMAYKAHLRTLKIEDLRQIIAMGGDALAGVTSQVQMMRQMQSNEGITLLDKSDEFDVQSYSFAGLKDLMLAFAEQISGSLQIPMTRLFGQAPEGLSTDGDSALHTYYDNLSKQQELKLRRPIAKILELISRSRLGKPLPKGTRFTFNSLWSMSEPDRAEVSSKDTATILSAFTAGVIDDVTTRQELRAMSGTSGLFANIPDEQIDVDATTLVDPVTKPISPDEDSFENDPSELQLGETFGTETYNGINSTSMR